MSILLDALKKSEEQRQLGKAPTIHSPAGEPTRDGGSQWVPLAMMTLAGIAMAWIGWQQFHPPGDANAAPSAEVASSEAGVPTPSPADVATDDAAGEEGSSAAEPAAPVTVRRPQVAVSASRRTPVESYQADTRASKNATDAPPGETQGGPSVAQSAPQAAPADPPAPTAAEKSEPLAATESPQSGSAAPHVAEPITYWELPQSIRDDLPELHISVLVFAERPENRFVLISGQRYGEQAIVEAGVVLEEIRRNGAVFRYRTYRFLVEG